MDKRIREELDACRPGSGDLSDPELSVAARAVDTSSDVRRDYERIGQWDAAIGQAVHRVKVPGGLADQILASLREAAPDSKLLQAGIAAATTQTAASNGQVQLAPAREEWLPPSWRLRNWSGTTLTIISAVVLLIGGGVWVQLNAELPFDVLAQRWRAELGSKWQPVDDAPQAFPLPESMRGFSSKWQWIDRLSPNPVVAYELTHGKAGQAMLYVAKMSRPELRTSPPLSPQPGTVGQAIGYWRSGDVVYVLVAPDVLRYQAFVRQSTAPLARMRPRAARPILRPPVAIHRATRKIA
jgi:hypothetical protein